MSVSASSGDQKVERLGSCVPGSFSHHIKQGPIRLSVQLIEYDARGVEPVPRIRLRREELVGL